MPTHHFIRAHPLITTYSLTICCYGTITTITNKYHRIPAHPSIHTITTIARREHLPPTFSFSNPPPSLPLLHWCQVGVHPPEGQEHGLLLPMPTYDVWKSPIAMDHNKSWNYPTKVVFPFPFPPLLSLSRSYLSWHILMIIDLWRNAMTTWDNSTKWLDHNLIPIFLSFIPP